MRSTEPSNARLRSVGGPAGSDDWEAPSAPGPAKWAGNVGAWYEERRQRRLSEGGGRAVTVWQTLNVAEDLGIDWQAGDVIAFRPEGANEDLTGSVQAVEHPHSPRGEAGEVRLTLELQ